MFLKGDGDTGKSTVLDIIKMMFPPGSVGCITANKEQTFGLEGLYDKRVVMIPDMPQHFSKILNQSDFQSMITGESVSIGRKNKTAITDRNWKPPLFGAGNIYPDYKCTSGSIKRRILTFNFSEFITNRNTTLKDDIKQNEIVTVMSRCILQYRNACERFKGKDFWTNVVPVELRNEQNEVHQATSPLAFYSANGDDYAQITHKEGEITQLSELEKLYANHMKIKHDIKGAKIGDDMFPIKFAGYTLRQMHICKTCNNVAKKKTCGDHYNAKNRYKKVVICDMKIIKNLNHISNRS